MAAEEKPPTEPPVKPKIMSAKELLNQRFSQGKLQPKDNPIQLPKKE